MNTQKQVDNYVARQKGWIKANQLKEGDLVLVKKEHESKSKGWENNWTPAMDNTIQKILSFLPSNIYRHHKFGIYLSNWCAYPYTVLQKIQIKKPNDLPEVGDVVYVRAILGFAKITKVFEDGTFMIHPRYTTASIHIVTSNYRYATKDEIISYYNNL